MRNGDGFSKNNVTNSMTIALNACLVHCRRVGLFLMKISSLPLTVGDVSRPLASKNND